jgi:hypothetical protein
MIIGRPSWLTAFWQRALQASFCSLAWSQCACSERAAEPAGTTSAVRQRRTSLSQRSLGKGVVLFVWLIVGYYDILAPALLVEVVITAMYIR